MSSYLPPTEDLPIFNPSVFQNGSTEGITLSEADVRYVKKSGSIMTGALSTPSLLVNSIDVETQLDKISSLETKTTDIAFAGNTTTIANNLDINGILSTPGITNLQTDILANNSKVGISTDQASAISANSSSVSALQTKTTDITFDTLTTTIANNLDINGVLSTPGITNLEDAIDLNTAKTGISTGQASAISANSSSITTLQTKTTDITFDTLTTTIANNLDINGVLSTPGITNLEDAIDLNTAKTGISTGQASAISANSSSITTLETKTTDITYSGTTTTISNNLDVPGTLSTVNFSDLNSAVFTNTLKTGITTEQAAEITANTAKISTLGSAYISWANNSVSNNLWGNNNRLDTLTTTYKTIGAITISENATRTGAVDFSSGTYRIKVVATVTPRQTGGVSIIPTRADFRLYISFKDVNITTFTDDEIGTYGSGFIRNANSNDQGYGTNIGFESLQYFGSNTELSIKTQIYSNTTASAGTGYADTLNENTMHVWCHMIVEKIASTDITTEVTW